MAHVRASAALANGAPLSALCRRRHNADYADLRIMPTSDPGPLRGGVGGLRLSA